MSLSTKVKQLSGISSLQRLGIQMHKVLLQSVTWEEKELIAISKRLSNGSSLLQSRGMLLLSNVSACATNVVIVLLLIRKRPIRGMRLQLSLDMLDQSNFCSTIVKKGAVKWFKLARQ